MAYITTETVKEMRNELKSLFPTKQGWKLSVRRENYSKVECTILEAPIELRNDTERSYEGVNPYYIERRENTASIETLTKIANVLNKNNYDNSDSMTDYFDVGHYISISIGQWDKPFKLNVK